MENSFTVFEKYIKDCKDAVEKELYEILAIECDETQINKLIEAMRYSTLNGGKRVRAFLLIAIADIMSVERSISIHYASVIELIHAYSLVHDDLPALDNDDERRGMPSCHKKFGEGVAILTGDALLNIAIENACNVNNVNSKQMVQILQKITSATSVRGLLGGQIMDILTNEAELSSGEIYKLNSMKTGRLFKLCEEIPAILADSSITQINRQLIAMYVQSVGSMFQIIDDINDYDNDKKNNIANIAVKIGLEDAKAEVIALKEQAIQMISRCTHSKSSVLVEFVKYITKSI